MDNRILIWIDPDIDSEFNKEIKKDLEKDTKCYCNCFKEVKEGIEYLKKIYFKFTIIILSGRVYQKFITLFKNKDYNTLSKIIVFTSPKNKNEYDPFNFGGKIIETEDLINYIKKPFSKKSEFLSNINEMVNMNTKDFSFEKINNFNQLIPHIFFIKYIKKITSFDYNEQKNFLDFIYKKYGIYEDIKNLLIPIFEFKLIPPEILCKYYCKLYEIESIFNKNLNDKLNEGIGKEFIPFLKCIIEGINLKILKPYNSNSLYIGSNIKKDKLEEIKSFLENKNSNSDFPKEIIYTTIFLWLTPDKKSAIKNIVNKFGYYNVLYEIEKPINKLDEEMYSNIDISEFSEQSIKKILLIPFSSFEIKKPIEKKIDDKEFYLIKLSYLGKYQKNIEVDNLYQQFFNKNESISEYNNSIIKNFNIDYYININIDSEIIQTKEEYNFIKKVISPCIKTKFELLYRLTENDESFETFHKKCDNIRENIILIKASNGKKKFGGYYPNSWESSNEEKLIKCNDVLLFDIINKTVYESKQKAKYNIIKSKNYGPNFSGDLAFSLKNMKLCYSSGNDSFLCQKVFSDQDFFEVNEVEVFRIKYEGLKKEQKKKEFLFEMIETRLPNTSRESYPSSPNRKNKEILNFFYSYMSLFPNLINFTCEYNNTLSQDKQNIITKNPYDIKNKNTNNKNYILCTHKIRKDNKNKEIKLMNCFAESLTPNNEPNNELKENCEIRIDNDIIKSFKYVFKEEKEYLVFIYCKKPIKNLNFMFSECVTLTSVDFSNFNSSKVENTSYLFNKCNSLENINFTNFNAENVRNMSYMFSECKSLISLNLNNFISSKLIDMTGLFSNCEKLQYIDLSNFNTINVKKMSKMFYNCISLNKLNIESFSTENVSDMSKMFYNCKSLNNLNIESFSTENVSDMSYMFYHCSSLEKLKNNLNIQKCKNMKYMFSNCYLLNYLDTSKFKTDLVEDTSFMFNECKKLNTLNFENCFTRNLKNMEKMFYNCESLTYLNLSKFQTDKIEKMSYLFGNCIKLEILDLNEMKMKSNIEVTDIFYNINKNCKLNSKDKLLNDLFNNEINISKKITYKIFK